MSGTRLKEGKDCARNIIPSLAPGDRAAIFAFDARDGRGLRQRVLRAESADLRPGAQGWAATIILSGGPGGIVAALDLTRPIFTRTSAYGHFGRDDPAITWERTPQIDELRRACA